MVDHAWLKSFLTVARLRNFTQAAASLGLKQPTVSEHVRKLEAAFGVRLFVRDTHNVRLTPDGEEMVGFANSILDATDRAMRHFSKSDLGGSIRLGVTEDLVLAGLSELLRLFRERHPHVALELTVGLSETLRGQFDLGTLDVAVVKRRESDVEGQPIWRDTLVWVAAPSFRLDGDERLPLVLLAPPAITRTVALAALERVGSDWRVVCTSGSQSGVHAALRAGLGIAPHARSLMPADLVEFSAPALPPLGDTEFAIHAKPAATRYPGSALVDVLTRFCPIVV